MPSSDPIPKYPGVWKALIGQVWVMCLALQLGLGQVLEIQGLREGNVTVLQEARQSTAGGEC